MRNVFPQDIAVDGIVRGDDFRAAIETAESRAESHVLMNRVVTDNNLIGRLWREREGGGREDSK